MNDLPRVAGPVGTQGPHAPTALSTDTEGPRLEGGLWEPSSVWFISEVHLPSDFSNTLSEVWLHTLISPLIFYSRHLAQGTASLPRVLVDAVRGRSVRTAPSRWAV